MLIIARPNSNNCNNNGNNSNNNGNNNSEQTRLLRSSSQNVLIVARPNVMIWTFSRCNAPIAAAASHASLVKTPKS
jgi:hypothetical protein